jgi:SNF2 family DNA or RNA helicase
MHYDPWWNPAVEAQATDRAHRIGQKKTVYAMKMIASGTIEERVLALQKKKQAIIAATVSTSDAAVMEKLSTEDIAALLS